MEMILEKLELSEDQLKEITESFEASVEVKAAEKALEMVESKQPEYDAYIETQIAEQKAELETYKAELVEKMDSYLEKVVEEFVEENTLAMESAVKQEQNDALVEGFNSLLIAAGVELTNIAEAKEVETEGVVEEMQKDIDATNGTVDTLMEQVSALKEQNAELLKTGLIAEETADLTVVQKEKFLKLAETLDFDATNAIKFIGQLDAIKETLTTTKEVTESKTEETVIKEETLTNESISQEDVLEVKDTVALYKSSASHLY